MRVHVISNLSAGKGLARDAHLLSALLGSWGHEVRAWPLDRLKPLPAADLILFLERIVERFIAFAPRRWLVPNPEWWTATEEAGLGRMDAVLCKTRDALRLLGPRHLGAVFTGFTSEDRLDASIPRERRFLHVAGASTAKGTRAVLEAWSRFRLPYALDVVSALPLPAVPGVTRHGRLPDADLRRLQNACRFHLAPSAYEGFGHTLHEALSVGAYVVTTDAAPMNEWPGCADLVPPSDHTAQGLATLAHVSPEGVRDAVERCAALDDAAVERAGENARAAWLAERAEFEARLRALR